MPEFKIPTRPPIAGVILGLDENDNAVPLKLSDFGGATTETINYSYAYTTDSNGNVLSETRTAIFDGAAGIAERRLFTWDSNGNIQSISSWSVL